MKNEDRSIPEVMPSHVEQTVEIWHGDGPIYLKPGDARQFAQLLLSGAEIIEKRDRPPCPAPYFVEQQESSFAEIGVCSGKSVGRMLCSSSIGGFEFYLEHLVSFHKWLSDCLQYHRDCGCVNLKNLEVEGE